MQLFNQRQILMKMKSNGQIDLNIFLKVSLSVSFSGANCAFTARGPDNVQPATLSNEKLTFQNVDLNICNAYDSSTS